MAEVFLARVTGAEGFTRRVALKRVLPRFSEDAEFARLFVSEAQLTARLQHPNLVSVMDFDRDDHGRLFLVMELVDGVDLKGLLDTGPLSVPLIIYLAIEILSGLRYAHDLPLQTEDGVRGIVHRDISPQNVLLSWEGAVKISDFGIAKSRAFSDVAATAAVRGKPAYMSPEQANGYPLDGRSDLFAVGVVLWEMLCLRPLFRGSNARETISLMLYAPIPSPSDVRPDVPEDLSRVVRRLLVRDRAQRTPDAEAAITELVACADHPRNGRKILVQALAGRFTSRAAISGSSVAPSAPVAPTLVGVSSSEPSPSTPPSSALLPLAEGECVTLTASPGMVVDPVLPAVPGWRRPPWQRVGLALTSVAIAGILVGGGLALYARRAGARPPATGAERSREGAGRPTGLAVPARPVPGDQRSDTGPTPQGSPGDALHEVRIGGPPRT